MKKSRVKIAVVGAKGLPPNQGGIEQYCGELYQRLVAEGCQVDIYARSNYTHQKWFTHQNYHGIRVITLPCSGIKGTSAITSSALAVLLSRRYDVVHFHALGPALFCWVPRLFSSATVLVTCHGLDWQRNKWGQWSSWVIKLGEKIAVRFAHHLIVVSQELETYFQQTYRRRTIYIPNAPPTYAASNSSLQTHVRWGLQPKQYILFLGRLVPEKCPDVLIQAFQQAQLTGWKLVIVGSQSDTTEFSKQLQRLATGDNSIIFTGELQGSELANIVREAGLFVLPSSLEGLPLAMLEAMNEGVPVLASRIPPHQQLLGHDRGILFETDNIRACTEALRWGVNHPLQMTHMARRAQDYIQRHHTWHHVVQQHQDLIRNLCKSSRPLRRLAQAKKLAKISSK